MKLTVTGESTLCTLLSSTRISRALAHKAFTSLSLMTSHLLNCSICRSRSLVSDIICNRHHNIQQNKHTCIMGCIAPFHRYFHILPSWRKSEIVRNSLGKEINIPHLKVKLSSSTCSWLCLTKSKITGVVSYEKANRYCTKSTTTIKSHTKCGKKSPQIHRHRAKDFEKIDSENSHVILQL